MSNYPGYNPQGQFQQPGQGFAPPQPMQPGTGFAPPSGGSPFPMQPGQGFAVPPPPGGSFASAPMQPGRGFAPPPPGTIGGGRTAPPPPMGGGSMSMQNLNAAMGGMNLNQSNGFQPPPPGSSVPLPPPGSAQVPAPPAPMNQFAPGTQPGAPQGFVDADVDFDNIIPKEIFRSTTSTLPTSAAMAASCKVPTGGILRPFSNLEDSEMDVIQPGAAGIIRCKRCRTYVNPFVGWLENGRRWRCNICTQLNETPSAYFCHLDEKNQRRDVAQRPELRQTVVEWVAPSEYMVRAPQAPAFFFVLDVSMNAVRTGMLASAASAIKRSLDDLPGGERTMVGFITFDNAVHYYSLKPGMANPQMLVVADLNELFVPLPDDLLVYLKDSRDAVESFLDNLPTMFVRNTVADSCLGPALKAAFTVMKAIGGKMSVFQSTIPTLGDGALKSRENSRLMGTPNEVKLLMPEVTWYKDTAIEFSRAQISVDMYLFPNQYIDVAALCELPKLTAGNLHSYVGFNPQTDGAKFESRLHRSLTQQTAFEAVLRIRCTKGMRISNFYGNFFIRGTDLLALPNCSADSVFGFDLVHDEQSINTPYVTIQSALLYTTSDGERRIRVATQVLKTTSRVTEFMESVDSEACATLLAKQAMSVAIKSNLDNARNRLQQTCVDMINASKSGDKRTVSGYTVQQQSSSDGGQKVPINMELLPLYTLSLLKNVAFRGGTDVHPDERISAHMLLSSMYVKDTLTFIHPRLFAIHEMDGRAGMPVSEGESYETVGRNNILLPQGVGLSVDRLNSQGAYLLDNGIDTFVWLGRASNPALLVALFGVDSLDNVDPNTMKLITSGNDVASRLNSIVQALHEEADPDLPSVTPKIQIIREGDMALEARFFWNFVEDRAQFNGGTYSYAEFMEFCNKAPGSSPPAPPGPPGPGAMGRGVPTPTPSATMPPAPRGPMPPGPPGPPGLGHMAPPSGGSYGSGTNYGIPPAAPASGPSPPSMPGSVRPPMSGPPSSGMGPPTIRPPGSGPPRMGGGVPPPQPSTSGPSPSSGGYRMPPPPGSAPPSGYGMPPPPGAGYPSPPTSNASYAAPPGPARQYGMPPPPR
mmetsp:Transcript_3701/g.7076  ORF Transcript_3701/g.7076 Transcript_3701/m.7076 type:complete len:1093 (+) Transcript_3701:74-3352(+)